MSTEELTAGSVDFALLHADGRVTHEHRGPGKGILTAIGRHIPDLKVYEASGPVRFYCTAHRAPDAEENILADKVSCTLGLMNYWWGLVAISMEPEPATGDTPPLFPGVLAIFEKTLDGLASWGPSWEAPAGWQEQSLQ